METKGFVLLMSILNHFEIGDWEIGKSHLNHLALNYIKLCFAQSDFKISQSPSDRVIRAGKI
jgi:hypothetical protein